MVHRPKLQATEIKRRTAKKRFLIVTVKFASRLLKLPGMSRLFNHTFLGATEYTFRLSKQHQAPKAILHLLALLSSSKFRNKGTRWWALMRQAITLAQDYQISGHLLLEDEVAQIRNLLLDAPEPRKGYDVAYCFVGAALWAFQLGDTKGALDYARQAIRADQEWGYPDYLMGWFGLLEKDIDPVPYFVKALTYNWSFFHRIMRDPVCRQHPEILKEVRQRMLLTSESSTYPTKTKQP